VTAWPRGSLLLFGLAFLVPGLGHAQESAEVTCKDGTTSHGGKGACSGHGGVDKSASKATSQPAEKATTSSKSKSTSSATSASSAAAPASAASAEVACKDGTTSHGGKGACSGHGGVDKTASATHSKSSASEASTEKSEATSSKSKTTAAPASTTTAPAGAEVAEVTCKDGTTSHGGKGACSGHGGVDKSASAAKHTGTSESAANPAPASGVGGSPAPAESAPTRTAAPAPAAASPAPATPTSHATAAGQKAPPTAKCKDGSLSYAQHHTGACSNHGGVAEWLDGTQK
jgi:Protein of unknown function (DUF3761)